MQQTIYCDCFYCEHYEDGRCLSPVLHAGPHSGCHEIAPSDEKLDAYLEARSTIPPEEKPKFYPPHPGDKLYFRKPKK